MTTISRTKNAGDVDSSGIVSLQAQLTADTGIECTSIDVNGGQDIAGNPDLATDLLVMAFDGAPMEATVDATLAAFDPLTVGEIRREIVDLRSDGLAPGSGAWADIPGAEWTVQPSRMVDGSLRVSLVAGTAASGSVRPGGEAFNFTAGRVAGGTLSVEDDGDDWGRIPGLRLEIYAPDSSTLRMRFKRAGGATMTVRVSGTIERSILS